MTPDERDCKLECSDLVIRYFTILDTGPRSSIGEIFADDGKMVRGDNLLDPREAFANVPAEFVPIHLVMNVLISPTGPSTATGEAYVVAYNMRGKVDDTLPRKMPPTPNRIGKMGFDFRKTDKGWRIYRQTPLHHFVDDGLT